jgi:hypothetical protein
MVYDRATMDEIKIRTETDCLLRIFLGNVASKNKLTTAILIELELK